MCVTLFARDGVSDDLTDREIEFVSFLHPRSMCVTYCSQSSVYVFKIKGVAEAEVMFM